MTWLVSRTRLLVSRTLRISSGFCHVLFFSKHTSKAFHLDLEASSERSHDMACLTNSSPGFKDSAHLLRFLPRAFLLEAHEQSLSSRFGSKFWKKPWHGLSHELVSWFQGFSAHLLRFSATCFSSRSTRAKPFSWSRVLGEEHQVFPKNWPPGFKHFPAHLLGTAWSPWPA